MRTQPAVSDAVLATLAAVRSFWLSFLRQPPAHILSLTMVSHILSSALVLTWAASRLVCIFWSVLALVAFRSFNSRAHRRPVHGVLKQTASWFSEWFATVKEMLQPINESLGTSGSNTQQQHSSNKGSVQLQVLTRVDHRFHSLLEPSVSTPSAARSLCELTWHCRQ